MTSAFFPKFKRKGTSGVAAHLGDEQPKMPEEYQQISKVDDSSKTQRRRVSLQKNSNRGKGRRGGRSSRSTFSSRRSSLASNSSVEFGSGVQQEVQLCAESQKDSESTKSSADIVESNGTKNEELAVSTENEAKRLKLSEPVDVSITPNESLTAKVQKEGKNGNSFAESVDHSKNAENPQPTTNEDSLTPNRGFECKVGTKLEAQDEVKKWYAAKIMEVRESDGHLLIHFDYWNQRFDEWIPANSDRLRPSSSQSKKEQELLQLNDFVFACWSTLGGLYPAKIVEVLANDKYKLLFYDGFEKVTTRKNMKKMSAKDSQALDNETFGKKLIVLPSHTNTLFDPEIDKKLQGKRRSVARRSEEFIYSKNQQQSPCSSSVASTSSQSVSPPKSKEFQLNTIQEVSKTALPPLPKRNKKIKLDELNVSVPKQKAHPKGSPVDDGDEISLADLARRSVGSSQTSSIVTAAVSLQSSAKPVRTRQKRKSTVRVKKDEGEMPSVEVVACEKPSVEPSAVKQVRAELSPAKPVETFTGVPGIVVNAAPMSSEKLKTAKRKSLEDFVQAANAKRALNEDKSKSDENLLPAIIGIKAKSTTMEEKKELRKAAMGVAFAVAKLTPSTRVKRTSEASPSTEKKKDMEQSPKVDVTPKPTTTEQEEMVSKLRSPKSESSSTPLVKRSPEKPVVAPAVLDLSVASVSDVGKPISTPSMTATDLESSGLGSSSSKFTTSTARQRKQRIGDRKLPRPPEDLPVDDEWFVGRENWLRYDGEWMFCQLCRNRYWPGKKGHNSGFVDGFCKAFSLARIRAHETSSAHYGAVMYPIKKQVEDVTTKRRPPPPRKKKKKYWATRKSSSRSAAEAMDGLTAATQISTNDLKAKFAQKMVDSRKKFAANRDLWYRTNTEGSIYCQACQQYAMIRDPWCFGIPSETVPNIELHENSMSHKSSVIKMLRAKKMEQKNVVVSGASSQLNTPSIDANESNNGLPIEDVKVENACVGNVEDDRLSEMDDMKTTSTESYISHLGENDFVRCICGDIEENGFMVQCERCYMWQHGVCFELLDDSAVPTDYLCYVCKSPSGYRDSVRYRILGSKMFNERGELPRFKCVEKKLDEARKKEFAEKSSAMKSINDVYQNVVLLRTRLRAVRLRIQVANTPNHPLLKHLVPLDLRGPGNEAAAVAKLREEVACLQDDIEKELDALDAFVTAFEAGHRSESDGDDLRMAQISTNTLLQDLVKIRKMNSLLMG